MVCPNYHQQYTKVYYLFLEIRSLWAHRPYQFPNKFIFTSSGERPLVISIIKMEVLLVTNFDLFCTEKIFWKDYDSLVYLPQGFYSLIFVSVRFIIFLWLYALFRRCVHTIFRSKFKPFHLCIVTTQYTRCLANVHLSLVYRLCRQNILMTY